MRTAEGPRIRREKFPNSSGLAYELAITHRNSGQFKESSELLARAESLSPKEVKIQAALAACEYSLGKTEAARTRIDSLLRSPTGLFYLADHFEDRALNPGGKKLGAGVGCTFLFKSIDELLRKGPANTDALARFEGVLNRFGRIDDILELRAERVTKFREQYARAVKEFGAGNVPTEVATEYKRSLQILGYRALEFEKSDQLLSTNRELERVFGKEAIVSKGDKEYE